MFHVEVEKESRLSTDEIVDHTFDCNVAGDLLGYPGVVLRAGVVFPRSGERGEPIERERASSISG